jgi:hypothetical protein
MISLNLLIFFITNYFLSFDYLVLVSTYIHHNCMPLQYDEGALKDSLYSLRSILLVTKMDVSRHILMLNIFILIINNMDRRE